MLKRRTRPLAGALLLAIMAGSAGPASQSSAIPPKACPGVSGEGVPARSLGAEQPHLILDRDFPDPFVARFDGAYHAYATGVRVGGAQLNVQHVRSAELSRWTAPAEALPNTHLPAWVDRDHAQVWAPEVIHVAGRYVLYFNARHHSLTRTERSEQGLRVMRRHCLGAAVADRPQGPYHGIDDPLVCSELPEGAIDAHPFRDGPEGALYLYYKDDGNCCGRGSALYVQGLTPDGLAVLGPRHKLLENADSPEKHDDWEWQVVEAPTMVKRGGAYYLFYSGNFFGNRNYSVGYLKCESPRGPCRDYGDNPILWSHPKSPLLGPGHQAILEEGGRTHAFFHGWDEDPAGNPPKAGERRRCLYTARVRWDRWSKVPHEVPTIIGGSPTPRP
jgi:beta-xylosidase